MHFPENKYILIPLTEHSSVNIKKRRYKKMGTINEVNVNDSVFIIEDTEARGNIATTQADLIETTKIANAAKNTADENALEISTLQNTISAQSTQIENINTALNRKLNEWGSLSNMKTVQPEEGEELAISEVEGLINATTSELSTGNKILLLCNGSYNDTSFSTVAVIAQWNGSYFVEISNPLTEFLEFNTNGTISIYGGSSKATQFFAVGAVIA